MRLRLMNINKISHAFQCAYRMFVNMNDTDDTAYKHYLHLTGDKNDKLEDNRLKNTPFFY